jgi:hypothetical protein
MELSDPGIIDPLVPYTPDTSVSYDYGSGLQTVDLNGVSWETLFNPATVSYTGIQTDFMSVSDDGLSTLTFDPTLAEHYETWSITIT